MLGCMPLTRQRSRRCEGPGPLIKIRYAELPAGIHVRTEQAGGHTVIYLLPGLTATDRRAALRRARSSARIGHGPPLPPAGLARAIAADWLRTIFRNGLAAFRAHPAIFVPPMIVVLSAAVAYLLLTSFTIRIQSPSAGPSQSGSALAPNAAAAPGRSGGSTPSALAPGGAVRHRFRRRPRITRGPHSSKSPGPSRSAYPAPSQDRSPSPTDSPTPAATSPNPTPSVPSPSPSDQNCLQIGPLGVCLKF